MVKPDQLLAYLNGNAEEATIKLRELEAFITGAAQTTQARKQMLATASRIRQCIGTIAKMAEQIRDQVPKS
jgi:hypothetical protein